MINNDAVVRTNYHKYFHPKEVLISNGVLNRAISEAAGKSGAKNMGYSDETVNAQALSFVYPYGATLNVAKPAVSVLSTGSVSFPLNRPVCAFYTHPGILIQLSLVTCCDLRRFINTQPLNFSFDLNSFFFNYSMFN